MAPKQQYQVKMREGEVYMMRRNKGVYSVADLKLELGKSRWNYKSTGYTGAYSRREYSGGYEGGYDWRKEWDEKTPVSNHKPVKGKGGTVIHLPGDVTSGKPSDLNAMRHLADAYARCDAGALGDGAPKPRPVPDGFRPTHARTADEIAEDAAWAEIEAKADAGLLTPDELGQAIVETIDAFSTPDGEHGGES